MNYNCLWCALPITSDDMKLHEAYVDYHKRCFAEMEESEQSRMDSERARQDSRDFYRD